MSDLPEYVELCPLCEGKGERKQTYTAGCGMGTYRSIGPCEMCSSPGDRPFGKGAGYVYTATAKPVPESVANQIKIGAHLFGGSDV